MRYRHWIAATATLLLVGCQTPRPVPGSEDVEILYPSHKGEDWANRCTRLADVTTRVHTPVAWRDGERTAEIIARNRAYRKGATHLVVAASLTHNCPEEDGYACPELPAMAYECSPVESPSSDAGGEREQ